MGEKGVSSFFSNKKIVPLFLDNIHTKEEKVGIN